MSGGGGQSGRWRGNSGKRALKGICFVCIIHGNVKQKPAWNTGHVFLCSISFAQVWALIDRWIMGSFKYVNEKWPFCLTWGTRTRTINRQEKHERSVDFYRTQTIVSSWHFYSLFTVSLGEIFLQFCNRSLSGIIFAFVSFFSMAVFKCVVFTIWNE